ncbi:MAG: hypothetical protein KGI33_01210 [Thaumarchaeota archaeon]|nr:hypothetical protein [Nitrososphaerota archaeon]
MIRVFGEKAETIKEGDRFMAHVDSVEGRKRVTLMRVENQEPTRSTGTNLPRHDLGVILQREGTATTCVNQTQQGQYQPDHIIRTDEPCEAVKNSEYA